MARVRFSLRGVFLAPLPFPALAFSEKWAASSSLPSTTSRT